MKAYDVETPALLLHLDVVERNLTHMATRARQLGVALRPHAKTHKCVELGRLQLEYGARGLTVATLVEAEVFARAGIMDLTWAFPIDPGHIAHARRIAHDTGATLRVVVDDLGAARALAGSGLHVWLKVDCGYHRAGVDPASDYAVAVARELGREQGLSFDGILSHSGHAYRTTSKAEAAVVAESERSVMVGFAERLRRDGISVREVSVGSTPAIAAAADLTGVTEARPGNYVFYDRTMVLIGCCEPADVGVSVLATVVSHQPGASHFVVDAGALELSKDPGPAHVGPQAMGAVKDEPDLTVATLSQEHGVIRVAGAARLDGRFTVGDKVEIIPRARAMSAPPPAVAALAWAVAGPPILIYGATRIRRGKIGLHVTLMSVSAVIEIAVVAGFSFLMVPSPRRAALVALPFFKIHLAFAVTALAGLAWQLTSRAVARLRPLHRHTGPYVVLAWCLALLTGIYNYVFLYVMGSP